ncbi:hypothetical protein H2198_002184 [Neophaeococcomyces mojaviensis]|uniref:Uncharacterized protein n=1 Tax=Neophaeococcomyces mojaviensis TaxID=3383035 RepID=A0ACC3AES8_9EURO|nr:hypothetical protein H2198_002184 [Knufia sp. JES_112]
MTAHWDAMQKAEARLVATLDSKFLPQAPTSESADTAEDRRLIFIGDIHGCMDELEALLHKSKYDPMKDHIIALGDVVKKGPKSREVVDYLMEQRASCVRGNQDDRILLAAKAVFEPSATSQTKGHDREHKRHPKKDPKTGKEREEQELASSFAPEQLKWLAECPIILRVGELQPFGNIIAVHGGLVPGIALEHQNPYSVMNMRIIDVQTRAPSEEHFRDGSVPWAEFWNQHQVSLTNEEKRTTVVFGHDKKKGLQVYPYAKGLDTGCVDGGKLTAWIVGVDKEQFVQVKSKPKR